MSIISDVVKYGSYIKSYIIKSFQGIADWLIPTYATNYVEDELPSPLKRKTVYIVHEDGFSEHAVMICPCGCKKVLYMNLIPDEKPCWSYTKHSNGTISLHPSVWRQKGCGSHFWLRNGYIEWCK